MVLGVKLLKDVGFELSVHADSSYDLLALIMRCCLHKICELGRVHPPQLAERDLQASRRNVSDERLNVGPVDHATRLDQVAQPPR